MIIEVNGVQYAGFTNASASKALDNLSSTFSFNAASNDGTPAPFRGGEECRVLIDKELFLTGFIEIVEVGGDAGSHKISITGRDKTGDYLDSTLGSINDIRSGITLKELIELTLIQLGSNLKVVQQKGLIIEPFVDTQDLASPDIGQNAFEFAENLARKRQVLLSSTPEAEILITQSEGNKIDAFLRHKIDDNTNNVKSDSFSFDSTGRFNVYRISTQSNLVTSVNSGESSNSDIVNQLGQIKDDDIRPGRQFVLLAENAGANPFNRAKWQRDIDRARGNVYSATVKGFRNQIGDIWKVNTIINVTSDYAGISADMLVHSVEFNLSNTGGRSTVLSLVDKNSFTLSQIDEITTDVIGAGVIDGVGQ